MSLSLLRPLDPLLPARIPDDVLEAMSPLSFQLRECKRARTVSSYAPSIPWFAHTTWYAVVSVRDHGFFSVHEDPEAAALGLFAISGLRGGSSPCKCLHARVKGKRSTGVSLGCHGVSVGRQR